MPIARYLIVVGSALVVLLLIAGWSLPEPLPSFSERPEIIDRATIRIRSERKWPEKVVLDTNQPTIAAPFIKVAPTEQSVARLPDEMTDQTSADPLPKPNPDVRAIYAHRRPAPAKRKPARAVLSTHVAKARHRNESPTWGTGEECCRLEWADRATISRAASRKRIAHRAPWMGWHFPEVN